jgi:hypothetical protein
MIIIPINPIGDDNINDSNDGITINYEVFN